MDGPGKITSAHPGENPKGVFKSLARFTFGNEPLAAGLALFPSLTKEEIGDRASLLLHPGEINTGKGHAFESRRNSYLQGRIAGKLAMMQVFPEISPAGIHIISGSLGDPLFQNLPHPYCISIAHSGSWNAGLCFPSSVPMGIDVESITEKNSNIIPSILSDHEKEMCGREQDPLEFLHVLWTVKEALGKAIRMGFLIPHEWYEVESIETILIGPQVIRLCRFRQQGVFTAISAGISNGILSLAFPAEKKLEEAMFTLIGSSLLKS